MRFILELLIISCSKYRANKLIRVLLENSHYIKHTRSMAIVRVKPHRSFLAKFSSCVRFLCDYILILLLISLISLVYESALGKF